MKIEIDDNELKKEFREYVIKKIKRDHQEYIKEVTEDIANDILIEVEKSDELEQIEKKLEKIIDWIKDQDRRFIV